MSEVNENQTTETTDEAAAAAALAQEKAAVKAAKAAAKEAEKAAKAAEREAAKAAKEAEKVAKEQAKIDAKAAKEAAKEAAKAAKEANRQPEQNGIRRPGPTGACGRVWALADELSQKLGQAVPIANLLEAGLAENLNASNVRVEYARWKKFHGLTGRIVLAKPEAEAAPAAE